MLSIRCSLFRLLLVSLMEIHFIGVGNKNIVFSAVMDLFKRLSIWEIRVYVLLLIYDPQASYYTVLKLLVLQCLVNNGLPPKSFDSIRRDLVQLYGFQCIPLLNHLQQMRRDRIGA